MSLPPQQQPPQQPQPQASFGQPPQQAQQPHPQQVAGTHLHTGPSQTAHSWLTQQSEEQHSADMRVNDSAGAKGFGVLWPPIVLIISSLLAILSLFLPAVNVSLLGQTGTVSYMDLVAEGASSEGTYLLVLAIIAIALAALALLTRKKIWWILAGIGGLIAGGLAALDGGLSTVNSISAALGSPGFGAILLAIMGVVMFVAAFAHFVQMRKLH